MIYYISDTHFNDQKIFDKCKRPFESLDEMKETIIKKWNNKVKDEDTIYVLGDIGKDDDPNSKTKNLPTSLLIYNPNSIPVRIKYMIFS